MKWGLHLYEGNYSLDLQLWAIGRDHVNNIKVICILLHIHKSFNKYLDNNDCHPVIRNLNPILQIISFKISMMIKLMYSHSREKWKYKNIYSKHYKYAMEYAMNMLWNRRCLSVGKNCGCQESVCCMCNFIRPPVLLLSRLTVSMKSPPQASALLARNVELRLQGCRLLTAVQVWWQ